MKTVKPTLCWVKAACAACIMMLAMGVSATEQVYTFTNPTFGGNPNNAPGLLANAQAQNGTKAPVISALTTFNNNLQNAILSHLSSLAINTIFKGDTSLQVGTFDTGAYTIVVAPTGSNGDVTVTTTDKTTGSTASFTVSNSGPNAGLGP